MRRGKHSNYQLKDDLKAQVIRLIRTRCRGMSQSGAWRLLNAGFCLSISKETFRKLMIDEYTCVAQSGSLFAYLTNDRCRAFVQAYRLLLDGLA